MTSHDRSTQSTKSNEEIPIRDHARALLYRPVPSRADLDTWRNLSAHELHSIPLIFFQRFPLRTMFAPFCTVQSRHVQYFRRGSPWGVGDAFSFSHSLTQSVFQRFLESLITCTYRTYVFVNDVPWAHILLVPRAVYLILYD